MRRGRQTKGREVGRQHTDVELLIRKLGLGEFVLLLELLIVEGSDPLGT